MAGHVYDEDGEPVAGAEVQALRFHYQDGSRRLAPEQAAQTNDLGEYRLYGLVPGPYYVSASYNPGRFGNEAPEARYAALYYPGSADPNRASALDLHGGDELPGVDFTLAPVRTFRVSGHVYDAVNGRPGVHATVWLMPRDSEVQSWSPTAENFVQDPRGAFELRSISPGSYYLTAATRTTASNTWPGSRWTSQTRMSHR